MKNVHIIPTKGIDRGKGALFMDSVENKLVINSYNKNISFIDCGYYNLYITNSEEIKEGDWVYYENGDLKGIHKVVNGQRPKTMILRKIILTTEVDLIAGGVQGIEDSFLEWFVNNPSCEQVETERIEDGKYVDRFADGSVIEGIYENYKIITPNDEPKQIDENGSPMTFWGGLKNHKKEETLEEEVKAFAMGRVELDPIYANGLYYGFIECGKSKWFQVEKIKVQIEENLSVLEMLKTHGTESSIFRVKMRTEGLEKELKQLHDGI